MKGTKGWAEESESLRVAGFFLGVVCLFFVAPAFVLVCFFFTRLIKGSSSELSPLGSVKEKAPKEGVMVLVAMFSLSLNNQEYLVSFLKPSFVMLCSSALHLSSLVSSSWQQGSPEAHRHHHRHRRHLSCCLGVCKNEVVLLISTRNFSVASGQLSLFSMYL